MNRKQFIASVLGLGIIKLGKTEKPEPLYPIIKFKSWDHFPTNANTGDVWKVTVSPKRMSGNIEVSDELIKFASDGD